MRVLGTAGHVDHGKSTLVKALTGTDPDRLKEEKKRQMTIELGFAFFEAEDGEQIGIIDVPGHRDFIENMLAGVGGIDAVLLVIAADEGIMPQTREHLAIIDLLQIKKGIIVLTKTDLISDPEWFELVENDLRNVLVGTVLENASVLRVSAQTGEGIANLKKEIYKVLAGLPAPRDIGRPRLPVDRVFSIQGFGTIATGTLSGGTFHVGDSVEILTSGKISRIRGLQSHNQQENQILPGSRAAMNLAGIAHTDIQRGDVISLPGVFNPTRRIDAQVRVLPDVSKGLHHNDLVKLFLTSFERIGRIRLLGKEVINPGEIGWVQIEFHEGMVAEKNDRFVLRRLSPAETIGGGIIVNIDPGYRYRLKDEVILSRLEARLKPSEIDVLYNLIEDSKFISIEKILHTLKTSEMPIENELRSLCESKRLILLQGKARKYFITTGNWEQITQRMNKFIREYHEKLSLRPGLPFEDLKKKLSLQDDLFHACMQSWLDNGLVKVEGSFAALPDFQIRYSPQQSRRVDSVNRIMEENPFNPPDADEIREILGSDLYQSLADAQVLIQITPDIIFRYAEINKMQDFVVEKCKNEETITVAQFRDHFSTSRKYALAFLEYLDRKGITERVGDARKLKRRP